MKSNKKVILIVGMHRSGTSALTRVLGLLGFGLPSELLPTIEGINNKGFWEPQKIVDIHEDILKTNKNAWYYLTDIEESWFESDESSQFGALIEEFLLKELSDKESIIIKDPRLCLVLPLWLKILNKLEIEPLIIIPIRNPLEIAMSLEKRDGILVEYGVALWAKYFLKAEKYSRKFKRSFTNYNNLLLNYKETLELISKDLSIEYPVSINKSEEAILDFLSPSLKRQKFSDEEFYNNNIFPQWIKDIYDLSIQNKINEQLFDFISLNSLETSGYYISLCENNVSKLFELHSNIFSLNAEIWALKEKNSLLNIQNIELLNYNNDLYKKIILLNFQNKKSKEIIQKLEKSYLYKLNKFLRKVEYKIYASYKKFISILLRKPFYSNIERNIIEAIRKSNLFDLEYYNSQLDKTLSLEEGIKHFIREGVSIGLNPNPYFNCEYYLETNKDIKENNINPLYHFIISGAIECRNPNPKFDILNYFKDNSYLLENIYINPLNDYISKEKELSE